MHTDPVAYFITWTCYGTWLPGDDRGWTKWQKGEIVPQPLLADWCSKQMTEQTIVLNERQRTIVEETIMGHCTMRGWHLHAVNCRSNHCHVVITAGDYDGEQVRDQFKAWCTRKLKEADGDDSSCESETLASPNSTRRKSKMKAEGRKPSGHALRVNWWTRKGSVRYLFDDESLEAAIRYTTEAQDVGGSNFDG